jgi:DNA polymerase-3 subunit beta
MVREKQEDHCMKHDSISNTETALPADVGAAIVAEAAKVAPVVTFRATLEREAFMAAVALVGRVIESRNTIPVLANVKLLATDNGLLVAGTDLDMQIGTRVFAQGMTPGFAATVPAHMLLKVLKHGTKGSNATLEYSSDNAVLAVRMGRYKVNLTTLPADDWPELIFAPEHKATHVQEFMLATADIGRALERVKFCISREETRYYLNGVYMHAWQGSRVRPVALRFVATDGHRMAIAQFAAPQGVVPYGADGNGGVILPQKTVAEVTRLFLAKGAADTVKVRQHEARTEFTIGDTVVVTKHIDGTFPDYQRVLPSGNDKLLRVDRDEFLDGVGKASAISSERGRAVKLSLNGSVILTATNPDTGSASVEIDGDWNSDYLDIGFNSQYMQAILDECQSDVVELRLADPGSPMLITGRPGGGDDGVQFVLMPMRV